MIKKENIFFAFFFLAVLGGSVFIFGRKLDRSPSASDSNASKRESSAEISEERIAYERAFLRAKEWHNDAVLAYMSTTSATDASYTFIAESAPGIGFVVTLQGSDVITVDETEYAGTLGAPFPSLSISQEQAIERVRGMPGYEDAEILGVDAVYGKTSEVWYFGVQTDKGTVSIETR